MNAKLFILTILVGSLYAQRTITWSKHSISSLVDGAKENMVVDLDNDGDFDIVVAANPEGGSGIEDGTSTGRNVLWFENDGSQSFTLRVIDLLLLGARVVDAGDLNGDGFMDVVSGSSSDSSLTWYESDGSPSDGGWTKHTIGANAPFNYAVKLFDIDNDGDLDIVDGIGDDATPSDIIIDSLRWFENDGRNPPIFTIHLISEYSSPNAVFAADFDGDNTMDIISSAWNNNTLTPQTGEDIEWWSQNNGEWVYKQTLIDTYGGNDLFVADIDGDNDSDVFAAGYKTERIDWWRNTNGNFGAVIPIKSNFSYSRSVFSGDIDGDGDEDLVAVADNDNTVSWFENNGNSPTPSFTEHQIATDFTYAYYASIEDMDGDGDKDIIGTSQNDDELAWWENDLEDTKMIAAGDQPSESFWNGKVDIDFSSGVAGNVSVFYNAGFNPNRTSVEASQVDHIAKKGFYTILTEKSSYNCDLVFSYSGISEWSAIDDETDLIICYWDDTAEEWKRMPTQTVNELNNEITVTNVSDKLTKYSYFTLGSSTTDNSLPVQLISFNGKVNNNTIVLSWQTMSEINNNGFEIWRKSDLDTTYHLFATYRNNEELEGLGTSSVGKKYSFIDNSVKPGMSYSYKLIDWDISGAKNESGIVVVDFIPKGIVKVVNGELPQKVVLYQNYPNPFNSTTNIAFSVHSLNSMELAPVSVLVYDILGQKVATLFNEHLVTGNYRTKWNGKNQQGVEVSSGIYVYRIQVGGQVISKTMNLVK